MTCIQECIDGEDTIWVGIFKRPINELVNKVNNNKNEQAEKFVDLIIKDIRSRAGLDNEWGSIEKDIQEEIRNEWIDILLEYQ